MNEKIKISVIVPVYNSERYLKRCLDSILQQTYSNFEILLIDDGSNDSSGIICNTYATMDQRVRVIHRINSGVAVTRNVGIKEAKGDYIAFIDSDDYIEKNMLEILGGEAEKYNSDIVMCEYFIDRFGEVIPVHMKYNNVYDGNERIKKELLYQYYTDYHVGLYSLWNKLIKKSLYLDNNILFDTTLKRGEDAWFIFQCLKCCQRVEFLSRAFYYYCQNENSVMHEIYDDQYDKWVDMRKRLLVENETFRFKINYALFYKEFLYKVAVYCRMLAKTKQKEKLKRILSDSFYINAAQYASNTPKHISLLSKCVKNKMLIIAYFICVVWAKL